jgi:hypothetical protein
VDIICGAVKLWIGSGSVVKGKDSTNRSDVKGKDNTKITNDREELDLLSPYRHYINDKNCVKKMYSALTAVKRLVR